MPFDFSDEEITLLLDNIDEYTPDEVVEIEKMVDELENRKLNQLAFDDLIEFCKAMMSDFMHSARYVEQYLESVAESRGSRGGECWPKRHHG